MGTFENRTFVPRSDAGSYNVTYIFQINFNKTIALVPIRKYIFIRIASLCFEETKSN